MTALRAHLAREGTSLLMLTGALAAGTAAAGWWAVPVIAAGWTLIAPGAVAVLRAVLAAPLAWGALLLWMGHTGRAGDVADLAGALLQVPGPLVVVLTLVFGALLSGSAALTVSAWLRSR